jgi:predicted permease
MSLASDLSARLRRLLRRNRQESELDEELRFHLDRQIEAGIGDGLAPDQARRQALLALGGIERTKEEVREASGVQPLEELVTDLRYAGRALRRNPAFVIAAVLVLGLGIGASVAVFAVVNRMLLSDLPYPEADRLVRIYEQNSPTNRWALSAADYQAIAAEQRSLDAFGAVQLGDAAVSTAGDPRRIRVGRASAGFFQALQIPAFRGRNLQVEDEDAGAPPVLVVSYGFATQLLGGPDQAIGKSVTVDGVSSTVVGVLSPGYDQLAGIPVAVWPALRLGPPTRRGPFFLLGLGRLKAGVTQDAVARDLAGISAGLLTRWNSDWKDSTARLTPVPLRAALVGSADRRLGLFGAAVVLVLLIAVANVATLMLVRALGRERELAVRAALGASRARLGRLVVTEAMIVAILAGLLGFLVAGFGLRFASLIAPELSRIGAPSLDGPTLMVAGVITAAAGLLVGLAPVSVALSRRSLASLRSDELRTGASRRATLMRGALVVIEFALALPLLLGTGLLLNSFVRLARVDPGYDPKDAVSVSLALPGIRYPDGNATIRFWRQAAARASELPGVTAAGLSSVIPPQDGAGSTNNFNLVDHPVPPGTAEPVAPWSVVSEGYFEALGVPLLDGRRFTPTDTGGPAPVVVVSRAWAQHYFPNDRAVGRQLVSGGCYECPRTTVVGVVGDVKYQGLAGSDEMVYEPVAEYPQTSMNLVVRSRAEPAAVFQSLREVVRSLDPELPTNETTLEERLHASLANPGRWTLVLGGFAAVAVVLAALGVFGLMSFVVRQRRREIGVRIALGAEPGSVTRMIVTRGLRYAVLGSLLGLGISLLEARWLPTLLFEVSPTDPLTIAAAAVVLLVTAVLASWIPGARAAQIRPVEAIGAE